MITRTFVLFVLLAVPLFQVQIAAGQTGLPGAAAVNIANVEKFRRTELYFGRAKQDGSEVPDEAWRIFLQDVVTPRFPDGLTVVEAVGQFRNKAGKTVREKSWILILMYPNRLRKESNRKIEEIRYAYVKAFDQQSVMRVDMPKSVQVTF